MIRALILIAGMALASTAAHAQTSACAPLKVAGDAVLKATGVLKSEPLTYPGLEEAPGCSVTYSGDGTKFGTRYQAVFDKLDAMMLKMGWSQDLGGAADGPTGTAMGYRRAGQVATVGVGYDTAKGVCRDDRPLASCHPRPAQMTYTIILATRPDR